MEVRTRHDSAISIVSSGEIDSATTTLTNNSEELENNNNNGDDCVDLVNKYTRDMDKAISAILNNKWVLGDVKWFEYYMVLERYMIKREPDLEPSQFSFEVQTDSTGAVTYIVRPIRKRKKSRFFKLLKFAPSIVGPMLGASLAAFLR